MTTAADDSAVEDAFEALLAGRPVPEEAAGLAAFTGAVRASATLPGRPHAALAELLATGLLADQSSPSTRTARSAGAPPSRRDPRIRNRRRFTMFFPALLAKFLSAGAVAQAATGAGVALVAFTGVGAVGVLPDALQNTVAHAVESVTPLDLPGGEKAAPAEDSTLEAPTPEEPATELPVAEDPATEEVVPEGPADGAEFDAEAWAAAGPDRYSSFGAWVRDGAHHGAFKADGVRFGQIVSRYASQKGLDRDELAKEGVDLDEVTAVPVVTPRESKKPVGTEPRGAAPQTATGTTGNGSSRDGNSNGNGNGNGNSYGNGNGSSDGQGNSHGSSDGQGNSYGNGSSDGQGNSHGSSDGYGGAQGNGRN
jgi:uncharacterized membrane protein YgcG